MTRLLTIVFLLIVAAVTVSFSILNGDTVELDYYFGVQAISLSLAILIGIAAGALFGLVCCLGAIVKLKRQVSRLQKSVGHAQVMVEQARAMPIVQK